MARSRGTPRRRDGRKETAKKQKAGQPKTAREAFEERAKYKTDALTLKKGEEIKVLSIRQPYATQILYEVKQIEYRTWKTDYRGRIYIHASGKPRKFDYEEFYGFGPEVWEQRARACRGDMKQLLDAPRIHEIYSGGMMSMSCIRSSLLPACKQDILLTGSIFGYVDLIDCHKPNPDGSLEEERENILNIYEKAGVQLPTDSHGNPKLTLEEDVDHYWWLLANPVVLENPIPTKGQLRLWTYVA